MSSETVRAGFDTWASSDKPSLEHPREKAIRLQESRAMGYLWMKSPAPRNAVVTRATLTLRAKGASSGARQITVARVTESWKEARLNWSNRPGATGGQTANVTALSDRETIQVDVTSIVQAWANGAANYGFRVSTNAGTAHQIYGLSSGFKPTLTVTWSDAPSKPTDLRPSEGATALTKPTVQFSYRDVSGNTRLAAVQVQIATNAAFTAGLWDSQRVVTTSSELNLATTSYGGLPADGTPVYWRVRVQDGAGLWSAWSAPVTMRYLPKPTVAITNLSTGVVYDPSPPIFWTVTGAVQTGYRVLVYKASDPSRAIYDSKDRSGAAKEFTIPPEARLQDGVAYQVRVLVYDDAGREATPGDNTYTDVRADFYLGRSTTVGGVENLVAKQEGVTPWVTLTWTRSSTPDAFVLYRDGKNVLTIDASEAFDGGTAYSYRYGGANPNRRHKYEVRAVANNVTSETNPAVYLTTSPSGLWIVDFDRNVDVTLWGNEEGSWAVTDDASVYTPIGSSSVVRIVNGLRGLEGNLSGLLMEGFGKTFAQMEADLYEIKGNPTQTVRLILGDENFEAIIGNIKISPKPETREGRIVKGVSFDFWQVGTLPFDTIT